MFLTALTKLGTILNYVNLLKQYYLSQLRELDSQPREIEVMKDRELTKLNSDLQQVGIEFREHIEQKIEEYDRAITGINNCLTAMQLYEHQLPAIGKFESIEREDNFKLDSDRNSDELVSVMTEKRQKPMSKLR
jgi:hypothetical protein